MGHGGGNAARGRVTGQVGDGGIDGTIREDALGLDEVYLQAKKYAAGTTVGEGALRNFAGAIDAANTTKGVFVTTAGFTRSATDYVAKSPKRIVLIRRGRNSRVSWSSTRSACAPGSGMRSTGSTRSISPGKTCKALVVSILVPQERLWVDDLPASANLG